MPGMLQETSSQQVLLLSAPVVTCRSHLEVLFKLKVMLESNLGYSYIKLDVLHQLSSELYLIQVLGCSSQQN